MKKTMKITIGIMLLCIVSLANAQEGQRQRRRPPSPEEMLKKATEELELTDDQVQAWKGIHEEYAEDMKENPREAIPKIETEIKEILSEEQWEKFGKMKPKKGPRG